MSRNKDIETLHILTGFRYSVLRKALKANGWNTWRALCDVKGIDPDAVFELGNKIGQFMQDFVEAMRPTFEAIAEAAATIAEEMKNAVPELLEAGGETDGEVTL